MDPSAQEQAPAAVQPGDANQTQEVAPQGAPGAEARIGELTAKFREQERINEELRQQNAQFQQLMLQQAAQAFKQPEPQVEVDPDQRKQVEAVISPQLRQLQAQLAQMRTAQTALNIQQVAAYRGIPPQIAQEAIKIHAQLSAAGVPLNEEDALRFAAGNAYLTQLPQQRATQQQRAAMNDAASRAGGGNPAPQLAPNGAPEPYPADFSNWGPSQQLAWMRKNRPGVEDAVF